MKELPRYQCHKIVRAVKIAAVRLTSENYVRETWITPADAAYEPFMVDEDWINRYGDDYNHSDPGYYVVYKDGYASWSPTKAFEEGYTLIAE